MVQKTQKVFALVAAHSRQRCKDRGTCGARNVFEDLAPLVATVDMEAVIAARPQILLTAESAGIDRGALDGWKRYPQLPAVAAGRLVTLDADQLDRGSTRVLDATAQLCAIVEAVRTAAPR